ncbi:thioesterase [Carbonactinospora thermoautotrophica]|uniref:thioesterase family protein n=1 Tax=Carbonactinospora thermoautotrophica TaxID=1469144 RepID=UPI0022706DA0|nr:hotdog domain-containing protein [Carbonactinospora thermoautotrophica]MCX9192494.1 thioesterase [Carbonactinospora thermoautotrophica]
MALRSGLVAVIEHVVTEEDTAIAVGSGDVPVLATPRLLALVEAATVRAVEGELGEGHTSVGTRVQLEHRRASGIGTRVTIRAELVDVHDGTLRFEVLAEDEHGELVGHGQITRVVVERERFLTRLRARA